MSVVVLAEERRAAGATVRRFAALAEAVAAEGLEGVAALRPLLNGKEIQALLDLPNGPGVGMAFAVDEALTDWGHVLDVG